MMKTGHLKRSVQRFNSNYCLGKK